MDHGARLVPQVVGDLGSQVEVLAAGAKSGCGQNHVPHQSLVPFVQALVNLVHAPEGDSCELLEGEHEQGRGHTPLPAGLVVGCQFLNIIFINFMNLNN